MAVDVNPLLIWTPNNKVTWFLIKIIYDHASLIPVL